MVRVCGMFEMIGSRAEARRKRRDGFPSFLVAVGAVCLVLGWVVVASDPYADLADRVAESGPEAATAAGGLRDARAARDDAFDERLAALPRVAD